MAPKSWYQIQQIKLVETKRYAASENPNDVVKVKNFRGVRIDGSIKVNDELKKIKGIYTAGPGSISPFALQFSFVGMMGVLHGTPISIWSYNYPIPHLRFGLLMGSPDPTGKGNDGGIIRYAWKQKAGMYTEGGTGSSEANPYIENDPSTGLVTKSWFQPSLQVGQPIYLIAEHLMFPVTIGIQMNVRSTAGGTPAMEAGYTMPKFAAVSKGEPAQGGAMVPGTFGREAGTAFPVSYTSFQKLMEIRKVEGTANSFESSGISGTFTISD